MMTSAQAIARIDPHNVVPFAPKTLSGDTSKTPSAETALRLYDAGHNVFPLEYGTKDKPLLNHSLLNDGVRPSREYIARIYSQYQLNIGTKLGKYAIAIDCESAEALQMTMNALRLRGIPVYGWTTYRGGHVIIRLTKQVDPIRSGHIPNIEIRTNTDYVVAAGSLHPKGKVYDFFDNCPPSPPVVDPETIDFLRDGNGSPVPLKIRGSARKYYEYLATGDRTPEGRRNERLNSAACSAKRCYIDQTTAENTLLPVAIASGLTRREVLATIKSVYRNELTGSDKYQSAEEQKKHETVARLRRFAMAYQWKHTKDRDAFLAVVAKREKAPAEETAITLSARECAELAGMVKSTANIALRRLVACGLLVKVSGDRLRRIASGYTFGDTVTAYHDDKHHSTPVDACASYENDNENQLAKISTYSESVKLLKCTENGKLNDYTKNAIGQNGILIYSALLANGEMTIKELETATGLTYRRIRHALEDSDERTAPLITLGMVARGDTDNASGRAVAHLYRANVMTSAQMENAVLDRMPSIPEKVHARRKRHQNDRVAYVEKAIERRIEKYLKKLENERGKTNKDKGKPSRNASESENASMRSASTTDGREHYAIGHDRRKHAVRRRIDGKETVKEYDHKT